MFKNNMILREKVKSITSNRTFKNVKWLIGEKIITMSIGLFVMAILARYLGPENLGIFNYALAFVTLFSIVSNLGLETLSVKGIIDKQEQEGTILYTGFLMRLFSGIILTAMSSLLIFIIAPEEKMLQLLVLIMSCSMIIKSLEVIEYWIQAYQNAKISSSIRIFSYLCSAILKVLFVYLDGSLLYLALIYLFDTLIIGIGLIWAYFKFSVTKSKWIFKKSYAIDIMSKSWYIILSGLMITIYTQVDKLMLGYIISDKSELGIYSAATQISTLWYFVPLAIITSFKPVIMKYKLENEKLYKASFQKLYFIIIWIGILMGLFITVFSKYIINILYGLEFVDASSILVISVWTGIFATLGSARSLWLIIENLQKYSLIYFIVGAVFNIILNAFLIPKYGAYGAAFSTILVQIIVVIILPLFNKKTRESSILMIKSIFVKIW